MADVQIITSQHARRPVTVGVEQQLLGDDTFEGPGKHGAHLILLVGGEHVDDPVDGLGRILGVQRPKYQVPGLRGRKGHGDGLEVTHLADEDHVRVLTQNTAKSFGERHRVLTDLALVDDRPLVGVEELDGILHRDDVQWLGAVDDVDQRRQGRGLS